jgi:lipopolysaccharide biosynthesis glycosyltransferase
VGDSRPARRPRAPRFAKTWGLNDMNILVTLNANYLGPLTTMLTSLFLNNPDERFTIYLMHSSIDDGPLERLGAYVGQHGGALEIIRVDEGEFADAPVLMHYTKEMYYRLLAHRFLPPEVDRILYLDPDILVLNAVRPLYETDLDGYLYAACYHDKFSLKEINRIRLMPYDIDYYYNSGVLLMNLGLQREQIREDVIYQFVEKNRSRLVMPDQDILNALYSKKIKPLDETLYNYDARFYLYYKFKSNGQCDMDYVINRTVILHFCGKKKPWNRAYSGKFHALYKHYERLAQRGLQAAEPAGAAGPEQSPAAARLSAAPG